MTGAGVLHLAAGGMTCPEFLGVWKRDPDSRVDLVQAFYKGNLESCLLSRA